MEKLTQKYSIVSFLEEVKEGLKYASSDQPLHVTIADTFAVDLAGKEVVSKLSELLTKHKHITAIAGNDEYFGPEKQVQVTILNENPELVLLHNRAVALLKSTGAVFNDPQYIGDGYRAHITLKPEIRLHKGDRIEINNLAVIDMFPNNNGYQRKVLKTYRLAQKQP